ncbi:putative symport protein [Escherichia coli]|uniref:Putative symport protein n=1 Tax=Escherichia coli TaxID=562 RepID=A0A376VL19_ECOLX|nr:putative symport protein [Escherichia coli]
MLHTEPKPPEWSASEPFTLKVFISHAFPTSIVDAMAHNEILQIVVFSIFLGCSLTAIGEKGSGHRSRLRFAGTCHVKAHWLRHALRSPDRIRCYFSIDWLNEDLAVMVSAGIFMGEFYFTMLFTLGAAYRVWPSFMVGPCIRRLTRALSEPALLAFTTSSSEAAFPGTLEKLEQFGVSPKICQLCLTHWLLI